MRIHEYLEIVADEKGRQQVRCVRCGHAFCEAGENYKAHALYRERDPNRVPGRSLVSGEQPFHVFQEYICPGCGTLLEGYRLWSGYTCPASFMSPATCQPLT